MATRRSLVGRLGKLSVADGAVECRLDPAKEVGAGLELFVSPAGEYK